MSSIAQQSIPDRDQTISTGLEMLAEHVGALAGSAELLRGREDGARGLKILDAVRAEESAKALILLDVVRAGWADQKVVSKLLRYFSNHLARGIYGEIVALSPATFGEVMELVGNMRPSHYLDGPSGAEFLYRNHLEAAREESFYVDYVEFEDGGNQWIGPTNSFSMDTWGAGPSTDLVLAMHRLGMFGVGALECIRGAWVDAVLTEHFHWQENVQRNRAALASAQERGLLTPPESAQRDVAIVLQRWGFPLASLDLSRIAMTPQVIADERSAVQEAFLRDMYG